MKGMAGPFAWEPMVYEVGRWVTLPVPPSTNVWARMGKGRMYMPTPVRDYERSVAAYLQSIRAVPLRDCEVALAIRWYRARRSGDTSNRAKVVEDAMQGWLYENDSQVADLHVTRFYDPRRPRIEVRVTPFTNWAADAA
jgi:Holliday junction resolvase RusA-like endonuclease